VGTPAPEARGLSAWSAVAGAALVLLLFLFFRALGDERRAWWATLVAVCTPLFWFTALRPLSDTTGLAFAVAAQALLGAVIAGRGRAAALIGGAFLATLAIGVRSQSFVLTLPLLLWALVVRGVPVSMAQRLSAVGAAVAGGLLWAVPLILASGGPAAYAAALGSQAGEDFSGVLILWTTPSPRAGALALAGMFLWPWGFPALGAVVTAVAAAGAVLLIWRSPRNAVLLGVAFGPYAAFHLLFHEVVTVRYALPLVVPLAYLFVVAIDAIGSRAAQGGPATVQAARSAIMTRRRPASLLLPIAASVLALSGIAQAARPSWTYARDGSPAFRAFAAVRDAAAVGLPIGMHAFARRVAEWERPRLPGRAVTARHGAEWLAAVEELRTSPAIVFVADPRRTDLALFDPNARSLVSSHAWGFKEPPFVGGARPGNAAVYRIESPGWMLDRGWSLTAEVGGVTERDGAGPHRRPAIAWVRSRPEAALVIIGGRHLGAAGDPGADLTASLGGTTAASWSVRPGFFVHRFQLAAGALHSQDAFLALGVSSRATGAGEVRVSLEQFDLQSEPVPMLAFEDGWYEPEYNPLTAVAWRWMSDRAALWIRPLGRDLTLTMAGESPLRYYDDPPALRVAVGAAAVAETRPAADFTWDVVLPHAALAAAGGQVVVTSDRQFVPGERDGSPDRRRLAVRIYDVRVR
jgi:4-amino-4-deoxy-L-arabinose transferase-like glycosyltransferase